MDVLEFAKMRMFSEQQTLKLLEARLSMTDSGKEHASKEYLRDAISETNNTIRYWRAYIDGAEAQKRESEQITYNAKE